MAASSAGGFVTPFLSIKLRRNLHDDVLFLRRHCRSFELSAVTGIGGERLRRISCGCCCCSSLDSFVIPKKRSVKMREEWPQFDPKKSSSSISRRRVRSQALPSLPFAPPQVRFHSKPRCTPRNSGPQSRDTPPKRDTGIANEKDWGINLVNENINEAGINEDGSSWYRESGEEIGENGYRCRWTKMGGQSQDGSSEWKETVDAFNGFVDLITVVGEK